MGDVCRLSWQPSERRAIRRVFSFSPPLVWLTARDSLSVWTVSLKDERHYHERTQAVQGVHAPVLTATWQTVLSGAVRGSTFETCNFFFFLERLLSKPDLRLEFSTQNRPPWTKSTPFVICLAPSGWIE